MATPAAVPKTLVSSLAVQLEAQSLNAIVSGFSFASAIAWMEFVRWAIKQTVHVPTDGGAYYLASALLTTLIAVLIYNITKAIATNVTIAQPNTGSQIAYAVTG